MHVAKLEIKHVECFCGASTFESEHIGYFVVHLIERVCIPHISRRSLFSTNCTLWIHSCLHSAEVATSGVQVVFVLHV